MENKRLDSEALKKEAVERLKKDGTMLGKGGVFTPLFKEFLEEALEDELDAHLEGTRSRTERTVREKSGSKRLIRSFPRL